MSLRKHKMKSRSGLVKGYTIDYSDFETYSMKREAVTRRSSVSLTSISSDSEAELSPTLSRRGRRPAIVDTKNVGDVSTTISTDGTPYDSCEETGGEKGKLLRKKSIDLETKTYQTDRVLRERRKKLIKRNTISDFYKPRENVENFTNETRKGRQTFPFSFNKLIRTKSKEEVSKLGDFLSKIKPSKFQDSDLVTYKTFHWSDLIARTENDERPLPLSDSERKRREAIWELFTSECVFLIDHLMVLKHCFMEPLKKCQVEGYLMFAEPSEIFGNLDELCYVSYSFCKELITVLIRNLSSTEMWNTDSLIDVLDKFSKWSEDGKVYHTYCLNYTKSLDYLERLRKNDEFCEFEKWCGQDVRCKRLQLNDFLVAPMQHCTKLPLLLSNIRKYSICDYDKSLLALTIGKVEISLRCLEEKMRRERNTQRLHEIQHQLLWPTVTDIDPRAYFPEFLRSTFSIQPCTSLLACPHRLLLHEGPLTLVQSAKCIDVNVFLFDDMLLIAKVKKGSKRKQSDSLNSVDKVFYVVYRQPLALDRLAIHDVDPCDITANGMKHMFVLVHISRFQQIIGVYTLQCPNEFSKDNWLAKICDAKAKCGISQPDPCLAISNAATENRLMENLQKSPRTRRRIRMFKQHQKKSLSMDTLYTASQ